MFITRRRHKMASPKPEVVDQYCLGDLVEELADRIMDRLYQKAAEGYTGWDDPEAVPDALLINKLRKNIEDGDWLDVLCLAALLWNRHYEDE